MPREYPSDTIPFPGNSTVGEIRDELNGFQPETKREERLLEIAQGLSKLLHVKVDRDLNGLRRLLPEEIARRGRNGTSDELLKIPRRSFPEDEEQNGRLLEES